MAEISKCHQVHLMIASRNAMHEERHVPFTDESPIVLVSIYIIADLMGMGVAGGWMSLN